MAPASSQTKYPILVSHGLVERGKRRLFPVSWTQCVSWALISCSWSMTSTMDLLLSNSIFYSSLALVASAGHSGSITNYSSLKVQLWSISVSAQVAVSRATALCCGISHSHNFLNTTWTFWSTTLHYHLQHIPIKNSISMISKMVDLTDLACLT